MRAEMAAIITISSHVAYGAVGNRIMVPALEALGISVTALSTVQLPWHPGLNAEYGKGTRIVPDDAAFAAMVDNLAQASWLGQIDGIITGYLGSAAQAVTLSRLVAALKRANPAAQYLCDPVIGDTNGLYVPEATAAAIRDHLWPLADIVTPNLFEFGWMTNMVLPDLPQVIKTGKLLNKHHMVVTSVNTGPTKTGNLLVSDGNSSVISHDMLFPAPNGTGDLLAALFLGHLIRGNTATKALARAASTVFAAISHANYHHKSSLSPEHLQEFLRGEVPGITLDTLP
jgi:pyridoxine kinase